MAEGDKVRSQVSQRRGGAGKASPEQQAYQAEAHRLAQGIQLAELAHRYAHSVWQRTYILTSTLTIVASGIATAVILSTDALPWVVATASLTATASAGVLTALNPQEKSQLHYSAFVSYAHLRAQLRQLTALPQSETLSPTTLSDVTEKKSTIRAWAPPYTERAHQRADQLIGQGAFDYDVDKDQAR